MVMVQILTMVYMAHYYDKVMVNDTTIVQKLTMVSQQIFHVILTAKYVLYIDDFLVGGSKTPLKNINRFPISP